MAWVLWFAFLPFSPLIYSLYSSPLFLFTSVFNYSTFFLSLVRLWYSIRIYTDEKSAFFGNLYAGYYILTLHVFLFICHLFTVHSHMRFVLIAVRMLNRQELDVLVMKTGNSVKEKIIL